uniref:Leucine rich repeats and calponin homology domain containing 4 n=1 Tax=Sarcophilus harrisii TaxID=9305 RepID=A0A7N4V1C3_SARHA
MAAAIIAPLAVGGEETTAAARVPGSTGLPGSRSAERALEEAVATGTLNLSNRRLKQFPRGTASGYDLSDITQAAGTNCCRCLLISASCPFVCSLSATTSWDPCLLTLGPWEV